MLSAQDCDIVLPQDTFLCGFSQEFFIQPEGGVWSFDCDANQMAEELGVDISNLGNGFCLFNFSSCGVYELVYTYEEVGVCLERDTFLVYVDDPSNSSQTVAYDNSLEYGDYGCHSGATAECVNTLSIGGEDPPVPIWELCGDGNCQATIYTPVVTPNPNDPCLPFDVTIQSVTAGSTFSSCWTGEQDSFILVDTETGEVLDNDFLEYLDSLGLADIFANLTDCTQVNNSCYTIGPECIDSIIQDTTELFIPVHLGGNWNLMLFQDTIRMMDTTDFTYLSNDYMLVIEPGADYYGPDNIDLSIYQLFNGDTIMPTDFINFQMQWTEDWIYDTLEIIRPEIVYKDSIGCKSCGGNSSGSSFNVPEIPAYGCGAISISFDFTCACSPLDLWTTSGSINCQECGFVSASSSDPTVSFIWNGPGVSNVQSADLQGICIPGTYTVEAINAWGCSEFESVSVVEDINEVYVDISPPDMITNANPCVTLFGEATSDFPTNLNIVWSGPNGFSSNELAPLVCEAGTYTLSAFDPWSLCEAQFSVTVEEMIVIIEEISAEICAGDCFELEGQEFCETGFYTLQLSPTFVYEITLTVIDNPEVIIQIPPLITATQNCVDLIVLDAGQDISDFIFSWQGPGGFTASSKDVLACQEGEYILTVEDPSFGCQTEYTVPVRRLDVLAVELCAGDCYELANQSFCEEDDFTVEINPFSTTELSVTIIELTEILIEEKLCPGETMELYGIVYDAAGSFEIIAPGANVCDTVLELQIDMYESIPEYENSYTELCVVDGVIIGNTADEIQEELSFRWEDGSTDPLREVNTPGIYALEISTACQSRVQQFELVETVENEPSEVYIPNIFSPNGDGLNEEFIVQSGVELLDLDVQIYDRWGNLMFVSNDIQEGWDGTFRNSNVPINSYVYVVEYSTESCDAAIHKKLITGSVSLMR